MVAGILGKKIGMTQVFLEDGRVEPVTAIQVGPCVVTQVRTMERDRYRMVQLGFGESKRLNRPRLGHLGELPKFRYLREVPLKDSEEVEVGQRIDVTMFQPGDLVDVIGRSKGRGFQGGVKRHGFAGGPKTHGQSDRHRAPGSIGATTSPGRVRKGLKMAGRMGNDRVTTRNLTVVQSDPDRNLLMVRGAVPGARNGLLVIQGAKSRSKRGGSGEASG